MSRTPDLRDAMPSMPAPAPAPAPPAAQPGEGEPAQISARTRRVLPIDITAIQIENRLRAIDRKAVRRIANSIREIGQQTPIAVRAHPDDPALFVLISGAHRIEAMRSLALAQIEAIVVDTADHEHRLIEIDENLMRADLTALDRGRFLAERKKIYFELHPLARHGGDRRSPDFEDADPSAWNDQASERTSLSPRTVQRAVAIGEGIPERLAQALAETPIADREGDLYRLSRLPEQEQARALDNLRAAPEPPKSLHALIGSTASPKPREPLDRIKRLWATLDRDTQQNFVSWLNGSGWPTGQ